MNTNLRGFSTHGVEFGSIKGNQQIGECPFCHKKDHFYINTKNLLWDCKRCGKNGNFSKFLEEISTQNEKGFKEEATLALAKDRELPASAFKDWGFGWNGSYYTLPVRSFQGRIEDLRIYRPGQKPQATSGATLGLLGASHLYRHPNHPVYICEGEWDVLALVWLLRKLGKKGCVVGVPGANVFKQNWITLLQGREVNILYDHDQAGEQGKKMLLEKLKGVAKSIKVVEWPASLPEGWDIRDLIKKEAIKDGKPRNTFNKLHLLLKDSSKNGVHKEENKGKEFVPLEGAGPRVDPEEVFAAYKKWLYLKDDEPLQVLFGTAFANRLQGDPLWVFLVAPPGGMKSELLMSISAHPSIEATTSITPHSLISGMQFANGVDPSLLPRLDGRVLVIKDFTTLLTMNFTARDEIFGVLRDCYDGKTEKIFGNGLRRSYTSHFGILAGVTPAIESFAAAHQSLGERFLKYRLPFGDKSENEFEKISRALKNIDKEIAMHEDLRTIGSRVLEAKLPDKIPTIPDKVLNWIIHLAQTIAMMRGVVERDKFNQQVNYKPVIEIGTRLAKQMAKLAMGIAIYLGKEEVDFGIYDLVRRIALDTAPDRIEEIVLRIWESTPDRNDALKTSDVSIKTRFPIATVFRLLQDLELLRLVDKIGKLNKCEWRLSDKMNELITAGRVYPPPKARA